MLEIYLEKKIHFHLHRQLLRDLVPSDLVKNQGTSEWKRSITTMYTQDAGMSSEDAKVAFLKIIYRWAFPAMIYHNEKIHHFTFV